MVKAAARAGSAGFSALVEMGIVMEDAAPACMLNAIGHGNTAGVKALVSAVITIECWCSLHVMA